MKWEPITSGKERELQQAYPVCVSDLEYRCNDAEDMLYLSGLTFCPPEKKTLHSHLAHNIAQRKV